MSDEMSGWRKQLWLRLQAEYFSHRQELVFFNQRFNPVPMSCPLAYPGFGFNNLIMDAFYRQVTTIYQPLDDFRETVCVRKLLNKMVFANNWDLRGLLGLVPNPVF